MAGACRIRGEFDTIEVFWKDPLEDATHGSRNNPVVTALR